MLRLVLYTKEKKLRVREAFPGEVFQTPYQWEHLQFSITENGDFTMLWTSLLPDLPPPDAEGLIRLVSARFPLSKDHLKLQRICPSLTFEDGDEWVFFGGSFNPWHSGHQACLDLIPNEKTCFILPDRNPQKEFNADPPVAKILEISSKARLNDNQFIVPTFLLEERKNPTVEWIEKLFSEYPHKKLSLLMGFDSLSQITNWIRGEELLSYLSCIYYVARKESAEERQRVTEVLNRLNPNLKLEFLGRHKHEELSSTDIRDKKGRP